MKLSEKVRTGLALEIEHRKKIEAARFDLASAAGKKRHGLVHAHTAKAAGKTNVVISKMIGMNSSDYTRAKSVLMAADKEPLRFNDLVSRMDETENINGTYRELHRRQRGGGRSQALAKLHHLNPKREIQRAVHAMEGICDCLRQIDVQQLDGSNREEWARSLFASATTIRNFARRIANGKSNLQVRPDRIHLWDGSDR